MDDDVVLLRALRRLFEREHIVDVAQTVDHALDLLDDERYAAVLADFDLQDRRNRDGVWLLEHVRSCQPAARRILITGATAASIAHRVSSDAIERILYKPVPADLLREAICRRDGT